MASKRKKTNTGAPLRIEGELTIVRAAELKAALLDGPPPTAIDLSGVTEIDSAGLQLLLLARREAQARQGTLALRAPSPAVAELFGLLGLQACLAEPPVAADEPTAVEPTPVGS
jgi:anti-sigma B factor antagonist